MRQKRGRFSSAGYKVGTKIGANAENIEGWRHRRGLRNAAVLLDRHHSGRSGSPRGGEPSRQSSSAYSPIRSEEHTSELQSLMRISYAVFCLKKKKQHKPNSQDHEHTQTNQ